MFFRTDKLRFKYLLKYISRAANTFRFADNIVLVYSMGKVGSTTVVATIQNEFPLSHIYHIHYLSDYYLNQYLPATPHKVQIEIGKKVLAIINKEKSKRKKIITLVREPVAMGVSHMFEVPIDHVGKDNFDGITLDDLKTAFNKKDHNYCLEWFDLEFKSYTGIDIYNFTFEKELGYSIYNTEFADVLVIKLEKFQEVLMEALSAFLNYPFRKMVMANTTELKSKGILQKEFSASWKSDRESLTKLYESKYCRQFYSQSEISGFINKWAKD